MINLLLCGIICLNFMKWGIYMDQNIKLQIRKDMQDKIIKYINTSDFNNYTMEYYDEIIDELFDLDKSSVANINDYQTYILRKNLGIFDNGEKQSCITIGNMYNKSNQAISSTIKIAIFKIIRFSNEKYIIDNLENIDWKNIDIRDLDLSTRCRNMLMREKLSKLGIICDYYSYEIEEFMLGKILFNEIFDKVHSLGLCFLEERKNKKVKRLEKH